MTRGRRGKNSPASPTSSGKRSSSLQKFWSPAARWMQTRQESTSASKADLKMVRGDRFRSRYSFLGACSHSRFICFQNDNAAWQPFESVVYDFDQYLLEELELLLRICAPTGQRFVFFVAALNLTFCEYSTHRFYVLWFLQCDEHWLDESRRLLLRLSEPQTSRVKIKV